MQGIILQGINHSELETIVAKAVELALENLKDRFSLPQHNHCFEKLLSKKEAAQYLKVSLPTLSKYIKAGFIQAYTISGSRMRFKASDLDKGLNRLNSNSNKRLAL